MLPPKSPQARPLETPLGLGDPNLTGGDLEGDLPGVAVVKDRGPLAGNSTVCWAAEMEGSEVANLDLGWQRRWTQSCIADSPLSTHLGSIPSGGVRLQPNHRGRRSQAAGAGIEHPIPNNEIHGENGPEK